MSRDLRQYARQTNFRLFMGFFLILFLVGDGLIYWLYGSGPALMGLLCLLTGSAPLILIWVVFQVIDLVVKRSEE